MVPAPTRDTIILPLSGVRPAKMSLGTILVILSIRKVLQALILKEFLHLVVLRRLQKKQAVLPGTWSLSNLQAATAVPRSRRHLHAKKKPTPDQPTLLGFVGCCTGALNIFALNCSRGTTARYALSTASLGVHIVFNVSLTSTEITHDLAVDRSV
ncbi:hypothetical protein OOU_Y34scaffold00876g1 [Pyricularia oryzae Y34]|uniref:Uncharacterized protein n=1 Tax=Pyricularia oryzae (strain Y34) TaxID=1143189 RepID=A0AA97NPA8_PYRO3|nr:hypothetical protein OOU_Y34scaffold00876g1 [Pyricularia oryzae Y34]